MNIRGAPKNKPLVLVGFMASGKSTVGELLADRLGVPFVDTDALIEEEFGTTIAEIFKERGEAAFRNAERELILDLLADGLRVIAAGGGAFIDPVTRTRLAQSAQTIWLDPPFEAIETRLAQSSGRPIATARNAQQLRELWMERRAFYASANLHIGGAHGDPALTVHEIVERLELA